MAETIILRSPADGDTFNRDSYTSLRIGDDFVSLTDSTLRKGNNKSSGKSYARFDLQSCYILKRKFYSDGRPRINVYRKTGRRRHQPARFVDASPTVGLSAGFGQIKGTNDAIAIAAFFRVIGHDSLPLGSELRKLIYPILADKPQWHYETGLGSALRRSSPRDFVETAFGKTRYRKDLMRAVGDSNSLVPVSYAAMWRGLVPTDWLVDAISADRKSINRPDGFSSTGLRKVLSLMSVNSRKRLLMDAVSDSPGSQFIRDTVRSLELIQRSGDTLPELGNIDGWRNAHDALATAARLSVNKNQGIPQDFKPYKKLDGTTTEGGLFIQSAKDTDTLLMWGGQMNNCIGGYGSVAVDGRSLLFGVYNKDHTLLANMELASDGRIRQLVGKHNSYDFLGRKDVEDHVTKTLKLKPHVGRDVYMADF